MLGRGRALRGVGGHHLAIGKPQPLADEGRDALDCLAVAARDQLGGAVLALYGERFGRAALAPVAGDLTLPLGPSPNRAENLGHLVGAERAANEVHDRPGLDRLALAVVAEHGEAEAAGLLQPQQLEALPGAEQAEFVHHNDGASVEYELICLRALPEH